MNKIGVIGAGTMGRGVVVDLVLHGLECVLIDVSEEILNKAKDEIINTVRFAPLLKKTAPRISKDEILSKITFSTDLEMLKTCELIIENVTENWDIKEAIYKQIDEICNEDVCFAVDTSCISITQVGAATKRPDKVIGTHFMNPVFMKQSIEVIKGYYTSNDTIETIKAFLKQLEKAAIIVEDYPGFVSNRISHLFMNEAAFVVQDGVATAQEVDEIFKKCFGHTMGPLETADLIGLDTVVDSLEVLYKSYQDSKFRCCPMLKKLVLAGCLGKKSGKGFYNYK